MISGMAWLGGSVSETRENTVRFCPKPGITSRPRASIQHPRWPFHVSGTHWLWLCERLSFLPYQTPGADWVCPQNGNWLFLKRITQLRKVCVAMFWREVSLSATFCHMGGDIPRPWTATGSSHGGPFGLCDNSEVCFQIKEKKMFGAILKLFIIV